MLRWLASAVLAVCLSGALPVLAQETGQLRSPILTIASDRLFLESAYGKRIAAEIAAANQELIIENTELEAQLAQEEKELTEKRPEMEPADFRDLADSFDVRVRKIRREQETKARAIAARQESAEAEFLQSAIPVLETLMRETGAAVILERRTVFLSLNAVDITRRAVERIDARIGDGANPENTPAQE